jgi:hypothetical protein
MALSLIRNRKNHVDMFAFGFHFATDALFSNATLVFTIAHPSLITPVNICVFAKVQKNPANFNWFGAFLMMVWRTYFCSFPLKTL